jgi:hypothetical protein
MSVAHRFLEHDIFQPIDQTSGSRIVSPDAIALRPASEDANTAASSILALQAKTATMAVPGRQSVSPEAAATKLEARLLDMAVATDKVSTLQVET